MTSLPAYDYEFDTDNNFKDRPFNNLKNKSYDSENNNNLNEKFNDTDNVEDFMEFKKEKETLQHNQEGMDMDNNEILDYIKEDVRETKHDVSEINKEFKQFKGKTEEGIKNVKNEIKGVNNSINKNIKELKNDMKWLVGISLTVLTIIFTILGYVFQ